MMNEKETKKKKKEKPVYIDDGSTVFDMSGLELTKKSFMPGAKRASTPPRATYSKPVRQPSRFSACLKTYFQSVKLMLLPMLVFLGIVTLAFLILWFLF